MHICCMNEWVNEKLAGWVGDCSIPSLWRQLLSHLTLFHGVSQTMWSKYVPWVTCIWIIWRLSNNAYSTWNRSPKWTIEGKFSYFPPPISIYYTLLFNGASNSVTDFLYSLSCYQLLLYFQSVKLTSWSVLWIQLSDCVQLKIAKSCKNACLEFSFLKERQLGDED